MEVIIVKLEETETGFSSYSDDIPGCISVGDTLDEFKNLNPEEIKEKYTSFDEIKEKYTSFDEIKEKYNYPKDD